MTGSTKILVEYCETTSLTDKCQHGGRMIVRETVQTSR
jgi:hypothetical protein